MLLIGHARMLTSDFDADALRELPRHRRQRRVLRGDGKMGRWS